MTIKPHRALLLCAVLSLAGCASPPPPAPVIEAPPAPAPVATTDPYQEVLDEWAAELGEKTVRVGVGNFPFNDTDAAVPISSRVADEIETRLSKNPRFRVITRRNIRELEQEKKFQGHSIFDPGVEAPDVKVDAIDVILRGRIYPTEKGVELFAEMVMLDSGEVRKSKVMVPAAGTVLTPRYQQALAAMAQTKKEVIDNMPRQFDLSVVLANPKQTYRTGEKVSFVVRSSVDCFVALLVHQTDGSTVVLFPNAYQRDAWLPAARDMLIPTPGRHEFDIEVGPPYGIDTVQVIGCTQRNSFFDKLGQYEGNSKGLKVMTRGLYVQGVREQMAPGASAAGGQALWSSDYVHLVTEE